MTDSKLVRWAKREAKALRSAPFARNVEQTARSNRELVVAADQFDANPDLLGTPGGVVDLRTGELMPPAREHLITKLTAVAPAPEGDHPELWLQFLDRIFDGDQEKIDFMQRVLGYSHTGHTSEHKLPFLYGSGANGKSTLINTAEGIMNDYARRAPASTFLESRNGQHPTNIAGLQGARLVLASELPPGQTWDEAVIKDLTGGDTLTARYMRQDFFDFTPQFTLIISGNTCPNVRGVDEAMRRRVVMIPFAVTIPPEERDPRLPEKLGEEWPAILRWCIDGAVAWYREGLNPPESILAASQDYLDSEDLLGEFLAEELVADSTASVSMKEAYQTFRDWAEGRGMTPWTQRALTKGLIDRGALITRRGDGRYLGGFQLRRGTNRGRLARI